MCGIAGLYRHGTLDLVRAMTAAIAHRGPDDEGFFEDPPLLFGNRRLAIQDLAAGRQPMTNEDASVVVVYNGEIYNSPELRQGLIARGHRLQTRCDTEILPHLYEEEGISFARGLNGIFAFALWDRHRRALFLVRDPLGVKPLLWARLGQGFAFGSEVKCLLAAGLHGEIDEAALHLTMNLRFIPGSRTLFAGVSRVTPGCALIIDAQGAREERYASIDWTPVHGRAEAEWLEGIRAHLFAAVKRQLLSDVPLGLSLSGGVDSTAVLAAMRAHESGVIRTFTLGFDEPSDENEDARLVAARFETEHHEIVLREPALHALREAVAFTEEPKVNCLQLYLLHRLTSKHVKVALSGLGGDELFAGYDFYDYLRRSSRWRALIPRRLHRLFGAPLWDLGGRALAALNQPHLDLYARGCEWLASLEDGARHYLVLRNAWDFNPFLLRRVYQRGFLERLSDRVRDGYDARFPGLKPLEQEALEAECATKMVADLLHNEDTMSMAHSVESRVPLLDLEFVRYAAGIPDDLRFKYGKKGLLKKALARDLPAQTLHKRKWGFTVDPVEQFHKDLAPLARARLTPQRLKAGGVFNPGFVAQVLNAKPHQRLRWHYFMLWQMIGLDFWRELFIEGGWREFSPRPQV